MPFYRRFIAVLFTPLEKTLRLADNALTTRTLLPSRERRVYLIQMKPTQDDSDLFRNAVGPVTPVKQDRVHYQGPKPKPKRLNREPEGLSIGELPETAAGFVDAEEARTEGQTEEQLEGQLSYQGPGVQHRTFQKLRRGQRPAEAELDLHGMGVEDAKESLVLFLAQCARQNRRSVRIIHGKGKRSAQGRPTIKSLIGGWLRQRREVLAYCSARPQDGGAGALYVLLKSPQY